MIPLVEMDYWQRSARISKQDYIKNDTTRLNEYLEEKCAYGKARPLRQMMNIEQNIVATADSKRLIWYGYLESMTENRWLKKVWNTMNTVEYKKRGSRSWKTDI